MASTKAFKVLVEGLEIDGAAVAVGSEIQLSAKAAKPLLEAKSIEPVAAAPAVARKDVKAVHFTMNDTSTPKRVFTEADHGENFLDLADEFHETNKARVLKREDV